MIKKINNIYTTHNSILNNKNRMVEIPLFTISINRILL